MAQRVNPALLVRRPLQARRFQLQQHAPNSPHPIPLWALPARALITDSTENLTVVATSKAPPQSESGSMGTTMAIQTHTWIFLRAPLYQLFYENGTNLILDGAINQISVSDCNVTATAPFPGSNTKRNYLKRSTSGTASQKQSVRRSQTSINVQLTVFDACGRYITGLSLQIYLSGARMSHRRYTFKHPIQARVPKARQEYTRQPVLLLTPLVSRISLHRVPLCCPHSNIFAK